MFVQTGKTFIATLIAVVVALGGVAWLSSDAHNVAPEAVVKADPTPAAPAAQPNTASDSTASTANQASSTGSNFEEGYRAGYRDGHQDCAVAGRTTTSRRAVAQRTYYRAPRSRVAGVRYVAERRRGHSTRNMILTIAAPAALGAGIGAIAGGGKGAGIGALIGGGGGALYHLVKHRRD